MSNDAPVPTTPARRAVLSAAERLGIDGHLRRAYDDAMILRGGPKAWRNHKEHNRLRLLLTSRLARDSNCVDVGANVSMILDMLVELAPDGHHVAFEPVPWLAERLAERHPDVDVRQAAVSEAEGETRFVIVKDRESRSSMRSVGYADEETVTIDVPVQTLDTALPSDRRIDVLKVDVEGAELLALRGAVQTLRRWRPLLIFEFQKATAAFYETTPADLFGLVAGDLGYRIFDIEGTGPYSLARLEDVFERDAQWNFFAVPDRLG